MSIAANSQLGNFQHVMSSVEVLQHRTEGYGDLQTNANSTSGTSTSGNWSGQNSAHISHRSVARTAASGSENTPAMRQLDRPVSQQQSPTSQTPALEPQPTIRRPPPVRQATVRLATVVGISQPISTHRKLKALKSAPLNPARAVRRSQPSATQNKLLALLPDAAFERFAAYLEWVPMPLGKVLYEPGDQLEYVYFPTTSIVSLSYALSDGASAEVAIVGNEGMVGISLVMGCETTPTQAFVQSAGYGFRLKSNVLVAELEHPGAALQLFLKYAQALMLQMTQTAVCNRHHSLAQQLSRRLLLSLDRVPTYSLKMTQELMAGILGVRREGVTEAAGKLQREGLIKYSRGVIEILDREGLERASCECYGVVKREFNRLFAGANKDIARDSAKDCSYDEPRLTILKEIDKEMNAAATTRNETSQSGWANIAQSA